jgi:hypothetical protein
VTLGDNLLVSRIADVDLPLFQTSKVKLFNVAKVRCISALLAQSDSTEMDRVRHVLGGRRRAARPSFSPPRRPRAIAGSRQ